MVRGLHVSLVVVLFAATVTGCAAGPHQTGQPAVRSISPASPSAGATAAEASSVGSMDPSPATATSSTPASTPGMAGPGGRVGTGITGQTVLVTCSVDRGDPPCPGTPIQARLAVLDRTTQAFITTVDTDAHGRFTVALPAGAYLLRPVRIGGGPARKPAMMPITVTSGRYTTVAMRLNNDVR